MIKNTLKHILVCLSLLFVFCTSVRAQQFFRYDYTSFFSPFDNRSPSIAIQDDLLIFTMSKAWPSLGSVALFRINDNGFELLSEIVLPKLNGESSRFGDAIVFSDNWVFISDPIGRTGSWASGRVYIFQVQSDTLVEMGTIENFYFAEEGNFGEDLSFDSEGSCLYVGNPYREFLGPIRINNAGSVHKICFDGTTWQNSGNSFGPSPTKDSRLGEQIDWDNGVLVAGARTDEEAGVWAGASYFANTNSGTFTLSQKALNPESSWGTLPQDFNFGYEIQTNGNLIVVFSVVTDADLIQKTKAHYYQRSSISSDWEWKSSQILRSKTGNELRVAYAELWNKYLIANSREGPTSSSQKDSSFISILAYQNDPTPSYQEVASIMIPQEGVATRLAVGNQLIAVLDPNRGDIIAIRNWDSVLTSLETDREIPNAVQGLDLDLYPLPASNIVTVELKEQGSSILNVSLFGVDGRSFTEYNLQRQVTNQKALTFNLSGIPQGVYMIKVTDQLGRSVVKKLVVVR